jgi:DNA polymerase-3 subunit beta
MKLSIPRDTLVSAVQLVTRAISTRSMLPSLAGVLFTTGGGRLTLKATDMEMSLTCTVGDVAAERDGTVLLPGRLLADVVRSLPTGSVGLEQRPEQRDVEITAGGARFHLRTLPEEDFPRLPELDGGLARLPAEPLAATIDRSAPSSPACSSKRRARR